MCKKIDVKLFLCLQSTYSLFSVASTGNTSKLALQWNAKTFYAVISVFVNVITCRWQQWFLTVKISIHRLRNQSPFYKEVYFAFQRYHSLATCPFAAYILTTIYSSCIYIGQETGPFSTPQKLILQHKIKANICTVFSYTESITPTYVSALISHHYIYCTSIISSNNSLISHIISVFKHELMDV
jgi:hypothetical protein